MVGLPPLEVAIVILALVVMVLVLAGVAYAAYFVFGFMPRWD